MNVDLSGLPDFFTSMKNAVELLKSAYELLPKGDKRDEVERKVQMAEEFLKRTDAKLANELGYHLCQCTFPPKIMLWRQKEHAFVCPDEKCGHREKVPDFDDAGCHVLQTGDWMDR